MTFDNYECDGQMTIHQFLDDKAKSLKEKYEVYEPSAKQKSDEGWCDDWHFTEIENPKIADVYYTIKLFQDCHIHSYSAWAKGKWYEWDSWKHEWKEMDDVKSLIAWMQIPSMYRQKDVSLPEKLGLRGVI